MAVKIALAGNPNSGKTTLFNALTGANQFVGNWPGVTVEKKEGKWKGDKNVVLIDLPGIYSLSPYTLEEVVARNYLIGERPDVILNIVDGTNLERNLYLSTQLMELGIPVVMAVNMADLLEKKGDQIHREQLAEKLGCEVVEISALKTTGVNEAVKKAVAAAEQKTVQPVHTFDKGVEQMICSVEAKLGAAVLQSQKRFFAVKLLEKDNKIAELLQDIPDVSEEIREMEEAFDDDTESIITNARYVYISSIIKDCITKNIRKDDLKLTASDKIDKIVTNRWLAFPIFAAVMFLVYYISVTTVGTWVTDWTNDVLFGELIPPAIEQGLLSIGCADWLTGLVLDGIVAGVGAVLGFVPQMFVLFLFLAFLEACGYMARVAFIMDRIFRRFGLSGKSFIPMLISSGCGVPGIMASRTIENDRDRKITIMTTTFIPCGAKVPIITLIAMALFDGAWWVAPSAYIVGMAAIIVSGIILKKTKMFAGKPAPFVMELPAYHLPTVSNVLRSMWERGFSFIKKAGTIILLSSIFIWIGSVFGSTSNGFGFDPDMELDNSILGMIGNTIKFIFVPLGFGNARATVATVMGLVAKEEVVGVFGVLDFEGLIPLAGYSFLLFNLLCAPCFAAIGAIKREMNNIKWFWFAIGYQCVFAYIISFMVYQIGSIFVGNAHIIGVIIAFIFLLFFCYLLFRPYKENKGFKLDISKVIGVSK